MSRSANPIWITIIVACLVFMGYLLYMAYPYLKSDQAEIGTVSLTTPQTSESQSFPTQTVSTQQADASSLSSVNAIAPVELEKKLVDALEGENVKIRMAAIESLALAPKIRALPVLEKVITGSTVEEKQAALTAMREIAVRQNDADSRIRNFLSQVGYHYDMQAVEGDIQASVDYIDKNMH